MKKRAFGKLYKELFYIPKHEKLTEKVFRCRMAISLLTMLACTAVLITSTWAWFNMSVTTQPSTIETAYYSVTVDNAENGVYICPLTYEDKHTFEIEAGGTASTGYCKIQVGENIYYTEQILQGSSLTLTIQAAQGTDITFTPQWGLSSNYTNKDTCGNVINHSETLHTTYKVEPTARLSSIAAHYDVTEEAILIYNNLLAATVAEEDTTPLLTVGMELKIPNPAENVEPYNVPYATYTVEATATLEDISEYYDVSVSDILTFNGITELTVGNVIGIPGVSPDTPSYVAPVTEPPASTGENTGDNTQDENNDPPVVDDTVSDGDVGTEQQPTEETTTPVEGGTPTDTPPSEDQPTSGDAPPSEPPTVDTPAEDTTPTEETSTTEQPIEETPTTEPSTPAPEETLSSGEDNDGEEPTEEPAPAGDEPTDTGATE